MDQSVRERDELQRELDQIRQENQTLKSALEKEQQDAAVCKVYFITNQGLCGTEHVCLLCNSEVEIELWFLMRCR